MQVTHELAKWANTIEGMPSYCVRAFAEAMEVVPYTLAENAGLDAITVVTDLRAKHAAGETAAGINVRKGRVTNILDEGVVVPLLGRVWRISARGRRAPHARHPRGGGGLRRIPLIFIKGTSLRF